MVVLQPDNVLISTHSKGNTASRQGDKRAGGRDCWGAPGRIVFPLEGGRWCDDAVVGESKEARHGEAGDGRERWTEIARAEVEEGEQREELEEEGGGEA